MKLIDKDKIIAEIDRRIKETESMLPKFDQFWAGQISAFKGVLKILDTLDVKEVDLEKECDNWRHNHFHGRRDKEASGEYLERCSQLDLAKYFFELGLKANQEDNVIGTLEREVKIDAGGYPCIDCYIEFYDYEKDIPLAKEGDKVKVTIIKGE